LAKLPQVQPVNAGTTGPDETVVVDGGTGVVGGGTGPVNETTNVSTTSPVSVIPTATHSVALAHDTENSMSRLVLALGLVTIDHALPSHTITNVSLAEPVHVEPTATHSVALTHDTEYSESSLVPALGLVTIDHALPFHTITNVSYTLSPMSA
jgi:hypothetical protein